MKNKVYMSLDLLRSTQEHRKAATEVTAFCLLRDGICAVYLMVSTLVGLYCGPVRGRLAGWTHPAEVLLAWPHISFVSEVGG